MPHLTLEDIGLDFPIYQKSMRQLRKAIFRTAVGGFIGASSKSGHVVVQALSKINLTIRSGERIALLGANGAGKTTLLRCMAGIYHPTAGHLDASGRRVPLFDITLGFDEEATGYENILLRGMLMGLTRAEVNRKIDDIASFSGLGDFLDLPVRTYSSGMGLRLLFSLATSIDAEILLLDEWIAAGDREFLARADRRLRDMINRSHILVFASHNYSLVESLCTRAVVLQSGRMTFDGPVKEGIELVTSAK
jgi:homopolymeric O-antigen transport system ATP-binding protein